MLVCSTYELPETVQAMGGSIDSIVVVGELTCALLHCVGFENYTGSILGTYALQVQTGPQCCGNNHHHHHVVPLARISLTLSRHFSLSFIASGRSSGLHPVSSHSCCMYVRAGRPAFARPYVGVHRSRSLMSPSLLLQQCPACLVRLTWIVFVMGGRWPYSWCLVGCCRPDLFNCAKNEEAVDHTTVTRWFEKFCLTCKNPTDQATLENAKTLDFDIVLQVREVNLANMY